MAPTPSTSVSPRHVYRGLEDPQSSPEKPKSRAGSPIPGAEKVPPQPEVTTTSISNLSSIITRIMVATRFIFSGGIDVVGTLNDMQLMEKCIKKLSKQVERFTSSITSVAQAMGEVAQTLPTIAEATARVSHTFSQTFPFFKHFFA